MFRLKRKIAIFLVIAMFMAVLYPSTLSSVESAYASVGSVELNATYFPDDSFRNHISKYYDLNKDGKLSAEEIEEAKEIHLQWYSVFDVKSIKGIEFFTSLETLDCSGNKITEWSTLPKSLKWFDCSGCNLTALPPLPTGITYLSCDSNNLKELPILPKGLLELFCMENELEELPALPSNLEKLGCDRNKLTCLPALPDSLLVLYCRENSLTRLPELPSSLTNLLCCHNELTELPKLPKGLAALECWDNKLTSLPDIPNSMYRIWCNNNNLQGMINLQNASQLHSFECRNNKITAIKLCPTAEYTYLDVSYNNMKSEADVAGHRISWGSENFIFSPQNNTKENFTDSAVITLAKSKYAYTGKNIKPSTTVTYKGKTLTANVDYSVTYKKNLYPGTATVTVTGKGNYEGTASKTFTINPPVVAKQESLKIRLVKDDYDAIYASWSKQTVKGATVKYKVQYKTANGAWKAATKGTTKTNYTKSALLDGKKYYVKVTPFVVVNGKTYSGKSKTSSYIYTLKKVEKPVVAKSSKTYVKVTWKNISGESGYQIARSTKKSSGYKVIKTVSSKYSSAKVKATKGKNYYYKVRAYKTVNGKKVFAPWSNAKAYKLKK